MKRETVLVVVAVAAAALACGSPPSATEVAHASLGGDVVARVGDVAIPVSLVTAVSSAQQLPPAKALDLLVDDALAASGARKAGLDQTPEVGLAWTAARARRVVERIREEARAKGPPTDEEVNKVTETHWTEVDLPEQMSVIQALVRDPKKPELESSAIALAGALATIEASATDPADFESRAQALPHPGLELIVQQLPPFVADGRSAVQGAPPLELDFVRGALSLAEGETSRIVKSSYGWHVIRMIERLPEHRVPFEDRRRMFHDEVVTLRAHTSVEKLEAELASKYPVRPANGVEELMTEGTMTFLGVARDLPEQSRGP